MKEALLQDMTTNQQEGERENVHVSTIDVEHDEKEHHPERSLRDMLCCNWHNSENQSSWLQEASGALGDIGTLLPLLLALAQQGTIRFAPALFWAGLFNVTGGMKWDVPMPVQPMKSIASIALTEELTSDQVTAAGLCMGVIVFLLGITRGIEIVNRLVPTSVVHGIQIGLGTNLMVKGIKYVTDTDWLGWDSKFIALLTFVFIVSLRDNNRVPSALLIFVFGLIIAACFLADDDDADSLSLTPEFPPVWTGSLSWDDFGTGFVRAALPQLPLTTLNSVVAVCALSTRLFPEKDEMTRISVATSVGLMNLIGCLFGAMPMCHGAGGLAGQYRFGARRGASVRGLGYAKMLIAIFFGASILSLLTKFPESLLGVLLAFSGLQLAVSARDMGLEKNTAKIAFITAGLTVGTKSTGVGALGGILTTFIYFLLDRYFFSSSRQSDSVKKGLKGDSKIDMMVGTSKSEHDVPMTSNSYSNPDRSDVSEQNV